MQLTSFVGRDREVRELAELLPATRLLTLNGAGGCGKTRLALQLASPSEGAFPDGVWLAELAAVVDPQDVAATVALAVGAGDLAGDHVEAIVDRLRGESLLVIDNCEHLLGAVAALVDTLLRRCERLTVLATSREPLGIPGETAWRVPSLTTPAASDAPARSVEALSEFDAVRLFCDRATKARPNFRLTDENAPAVAQVCHRLDGIPLAIELAAARVRGLTVGQIAAGLDDRFRLLTGGARTVMPRQQTLEASVDWSFTLLSEIERAVFRRLAVFASGFTLDAAETVVAFGDIAAVEVLEALLALVDKSMVVLDDDAERYGMLETLRQYGAARLVDTEEVTEARDRHLQWAASLLDPYATRLRGDLRCMPLVAIERDNLRTAFEWALSRPAPDAACIVASALMSWEGVYGDPVAAVTIGRRTLQLPDLARDMRIITMASLILAHFEARHPADAMAMSNAVLGELEEPGELDPRAETFGLLMTSFSGRALPGGDDYLVRAMSAAERSGDAALIELTAAMLAIRSAYIGRWRDAETYAARVRSDPASSVAGQNALLARVEAAEWNGRFDEARNHLDAITAIHNDRAHPRLVAYNEARRIGLDLAQGVDTGAVARLQTLLDEARRRRFISGVATAGWAVGASALAHGRADVAVDELVDWREESNPERSFSGTWAGVFYEALVAAGRVEEAREQFRHARGQLPEHVARLAQVPLDTIEALLCRAEGDTVAAENLVYDALDEIQRRGWRPRLADALEALASTRGRHGAPAEAARLAGAARRLRDELGYALRWPFEANELDAALTDARAALGDDRFERAFDEGRALDDEAAVAYATRARGERKRPTFGWHSLTPTETEVAHLVAQGLTNKQIAGRLLMGPETVKTHLSRVYTKLDIPNRAALSAKLAARAETDRKAPEAVP